MCRFAAYFGLKKVLLNRVLSLPENSLIKQSKKAKEGILGLNADGFGVAWYNFAISQHPGVYKSTQPAWSNNNLIHIADKIESECFLAHVRASTVGNVNYNNCHPFIFEKYAFVHNGTIRGFENYKKKIINKINHDLFLKIKGNSDSEYLFFLIMDFILQKNDLQTSVKKAIEWIVNEEKTTETFSRINIIITNGEEVVATRFVSKNQSALSLKYLAKMTDSSTVFSLILSSEALDDDNKNWLSLPENHYLYLNKSDMKIKIEKI